MHHVYNSSTGIEITLRRMHKYCQQSLGIWGGGQRSGEGGNFLLLYLPPLVIFKSLLHASPIKHFLLFHGWQGYSQLMSWFSVCTTGGWIWWLLNEKGKSNFLQIASCREWGHLGWFLSRGAFCDENRSQLTLFRRSTQASHGLL